MVKTVAIVQEHCIDYNCWGDNDAEDGACEARATRASMSYQKPRAIEWDGRAWCEKHRPDKDWETK